MLQIKITFFFSLFFKQAFSEFFIRYTAHAPTTSVFRDAVLEH